MILADKIVRMRKKNGWSQEELAQKMNVSRQAVSKWESAQTVPELEKILQLGALFGVTTDYLLKDDMELEEFAPETADSSARQVSIEEAGTYLAQSGKSAKRIAVGTFLCVLSPIPLLLLGAASEYKKLNISENLAGCLGIMLLLFLVIAAVALFIYSGFQNEPYEYLDKEEPFELQYGVSGMVREKQKEYRNQYVFWNIIATCICVASPLPLLVGAFSEQEFLTIVLLTVTILLAGIGACIFVVNCSIWTSMQKLLKEGDYTMEAKRRNRKMGAISVVYWLILTAVYLAWSFSTNAWDKTWIVYVVGGVVYAALCVVWELVMNRK